MFIVPILLLILISTFLCLLSKASMCSKLWNLDLFSPKQGTNMIWSHLVWCPSPFPCGPSHPLCTSLLHPCSYGWPTTSRCPWSQLHCAWRTHLPPRLLHSLRGSSCPCTPVFCPIRALVTLGHNCPPNCSFRAEAMFIHVTRCFVHGPFPSVGWMDSQELSRRTVRVPGSLNRGEERVSFCTSCSCLILHFSLIIGILCAE